MRTIKFRGKRLNKGEWVYGSLTQGEAHNKNGEPFMVSYIAPSIPAGSECGFELVKMNRVAPATVGQFTGLYDKHGREIYEGDIIGCDRPNIRHLVFYCEKEGRFKAALNGETKMSILGICGLDDRKWNATKEVIGNIHDNPELLEKGGEQ